MADQEGSGPRPADGTEAGGLPHGAAGASGARGEYALGAPLVVLGEVELGAPRGARATLVQFSTAFCQPCRAARRTLASVAAMVDGVAHVEIDAESRLHLVRRLGIERTPTVLVLDAQGRVAARAAGAPRTADVIAALGRIL